MKKEEALKIVQKIKDLATSDEQVAHETDAALRDKFIKFVALRKDELGETAKIIISVNDIEYCRWYA